MFMETENLFLITHDITLTIEAVNVCETSFGNECYAVWNFTLK